jgi:hypothetical protein
MSHFKIALFNGRLSVYIIIYYTFFWFRTRGDFIEDPIFLIKFPPLDYNKCKFEKFQITQKRKHLQNNKFSTK